MEEEDESWKFMLLCCNKGEVSGFTSLSNSDLWTLCYYFAEYMLFLRVASIAGRDIDDKLLF